MAATVVANRTGDHDLRRREFLKRTAASLAALPLLGKTLPAVPPGPLLPPPVRPGWLEDSQGKAMMACTTNPRLGHMIAEFNLRTRKTPLVESVESRWAGFHWVYLHSPEHAAHLRDIWSRFGTGPDLLPWMETRYAEDVAWALGRCSPVEGW